MAGDEFGEIEERDEELWKFINILLFVATSITKYGSSHTIVLDIINNKTDCYLLSNNIAFFHLFYY